MGTENLVKFYHFTTKAAFEKVKDIHFYSVVFIDDTGEIYTHGVYYGSAKDEGITWIEL